MAHENCPPPLGRQENTGTHRSAVGPGVVYANVTLLPSDHLMVRTLSPMS